MERLRQQATHPLEVTRRVIEPAVQDAGGRVVRVVLGRAM
jgi:hypothetical protein